MAKLKSTHPVETQEPDESIHQTSGRASNKKDELVEPDSKKFNVIIDEVETLFQHVQKPREQTADGEALLGLVNTLATSVKSHSRGGITPSDFISCLFRDFGESDVGLATRSSIRWKDIGLAVSSIFKKAHGCNTMLGPMNSELKKRETRIYKKRTRSMVSARPEELDDAPMVENTDTDNNMLTMYEVLKKNKPGVVLESLLLNSSSFAQTVENLFALSFLVRDGWVEITVNANGSHIVSPKNSPYADSIASREVNYYHFVFRFDVKDWKLMKDVVPVGEELMPHRSLHDPTKMNPPIRKFSRNQGLVTQNVSVVQNCSRSDHIAARRLQPYVTVVSPNSN
ncbi:Nse4/EID family [Trema orientale]|uniref:Non-structural maintenance of chromosomes element 4 n=1 Tax=Trema orientale TaxID=63057 RepID=A0A2P5FIK5_TREOI|nr:Nse4/EID family [Trema orientale]